MLSMARLLRRVGVRGSGQHRRAAKQRGLSQDGQAENPLQEAGRGRELPARGASKPRMPRVRVSRPVGIAPWGHMR